MSGNQMPVSDLARHVGEEIGVSSWILLDQARINEFAHCTGDHQWIHVEPERAAKGPYGGPIAHGYLTLSFCPVFLDDVLKIDAVTAAVNYGVNRVRFPAPVPVTSNVVFSQEPTLRIDDESEAAPPPPRKPDTAMRIAVGLVSGRSN